MEVKIRIAKKEDAPALLEIYSYYVKNTAVSFEYEVPSLEEFERRICTTLENYPYLVAETSIYVDKGFHRLGIGSKLYEKLEEYLTAQNVTNLYAGAADPAVENDPYLTKDSENFHKAAGYKTIGNFSRIGYKFDRWYNLIYMEKIIGEHYSPQKAFVPFSKLNK